MAHFPPAFIDEVLARTDLVEVIGRHVELKRSGSNLMGLCPFHHEKSPSFSVSPDKQLYYCFGCGKGGGAFQFLMEHDGYSFPEAVEVLAEKAGLQVPETAKEDRQDMEQRNRALQLLVRVRDAFVQELASPKGGQARAYIEQRGLPPQIVQRYGLGFAPDGYGYMEHRFGRDGRTLAQLEAVGVLFKGERGYVDRFRNRLIFPITDRRGQVVGFGGRILGDGEPKYLNSPETQWFHKSALLYGYHEHRDEIRRRRQLLVVEGYMDVLALAVHDLPVGLAPLGTAIGEQQVREILRLHDAPVFCFDGDRAGRQASWRALERMLPLLKAEYTPRFLYLPEGEDPDSLLRREGGEAFVRRMETDARPVLGTWLQGLRNIAGAGADGRARMAKKADEMLARMEDDYLRQAWRQEAEKATGIVLTRAAAAAPRRQQPAQPVRRALAPVNRVQERFLAGLLQEPARFGQLPADADKFFLDEGQVHPLYTRAFSLAASGAIGKSDMARALQQAFPDDPNVPRWINEEPVTDAEFARVLVGMQIDFLDKKSKNIGSLEEQTRLQRELHRLKEKRRELNMTLEQEQDRG